MNTLAKPNEGRLTRTAAAGAFALLVGLAACTGFADAQDDAKATEGAIKSELGLDSSVGFESIPERAASEFLSR